MFRTILITLVIGLPAVLQAQVSGDQIQIIADDDSIKYVVGGEETAISNADMAQYYLQEGLAVAAEGKYSEAEDKFRVALLYDLENAEILYNLGLAQYYLEDYSTAIKTFDAAAEITPNRSEVYNQRGLCKAMLGNYKDAETDFRIMLKYDPEFPMGNYNFGILMLQLDDMTTACEYLHKAESLGYLKAADVIAQYCNE